MKFLVLALCVCAASAATLKPWQYQRSEPQKFGQVQAFASAAQAAPQVVYRAYEPTVKVVEQPTLKVVEQPAIVKVVEQPIVKAVPTPEYTLPSAIARSGVYSPTVLAKNVYADKEANAAILRSESNVAADGFEAAYETENGIAAQSSGILKNVDNSPALAIQGSYQYIAPDGQLIQVSYIADENGFQPKSDILPVGPAIPEEIARSLEYIRTNPAVKPEIYN